ncbi:MAG: hypothetical protein IT338_12460 [Thermomicrobiales bacterium]|nr:hypothetical protein [Thermomicrobiales bacterium]
MNASTLMRKTILATAGHAEVERRVRANRLLRTLAPRFVAEETIDDAPAAPLRLRDAELAVTLDHLRERGDS